MRSIISFLKYLSLPCNIALVLRTCHLRRHFWFSDISCLFIKNFHDLVYKPSADWQLTVSPGPQSSPQNISLYYQGIVQWVLYDYQSYNSAMMTKCRISLSPMKVKTKTPNIGGRLSRRYLINIYGRPQEKETRVARVPLLQEGFI